jgi:hypothetical protein
MTGALPKIDLPLPRDGSLPGRAARFRGRWTGALGNPLSQWGTLAPLGAATLLLALGQQSTTSGALPTPPPDPTPTPDPTPKTLPTLSGEDGVYLVPPAPVAISFPTIPITPPTLTIDWLAVDNNTGVDLRQPVPVAVTEWPNPIDQSDPLVKGSQAWLYYRSLYFDFYGGPSEEEFVTVGPQIDQDSAPLPPGQPTWTAIFTWYRIMIRRGGIE